MNSDLHRLVSIPLGLDKEGCDALCVALEAGRDGKKSGKQRRHPEDEVFSCAAHRVLFHLVL